MNSLNSSSICYLKYKVLKYSKLKINFPAKELTLPSQAMTLNLLKNLKTVKSELEHVQGMLNNSLHCLSKFLVKLSTTYRHVKYLFWPMSRRCSLFTTSVDINILKNFKYMPVT